MQIKRIDADSNDIKNVKLINDEAFPPGERMLIEKMLTFPAESEIFGLYIEDTLIGFTLILINAETVYLVLLAIDRRYRGMGFGSQTLKFIIANASVVYGQTRRIA